MKNTLYCTTICIRNGYPELLSLHLKRLHETSNRFLSRSFDRTGCETAIQDIAKKHPNSGLRISLREDGLLYDVIRIADSPINPTFTYMPDYNLDTFAKRRCKNTSDVTIFYDSSGILEGNWFTIFFVDTHNNMYTPPLGRILGGTMRAAILYTAEKRDMTIQIKSQPPNQNFRYYASTSMRLLQPVLGSDIITQQLHELREAVRKNIRNDEQGIYEYWLKECLSVSTS